MGGRPKREGIGVHMADSHCCIAEINTTLQSNCIAINIKNKEKEYETHTHVCVYIYMCVCVGVCVCVYISGFQSTSAVKNLPAMEETRVRSLGGKIPWWRAWPPTPVFLPGKIPWAEEPGHLQSIGSHRVGPD